MNAFQNLWVSTYNFLTRFNAHEVRPPIRQRHFMEEVLELLQSSTRLETLQEDTGETHFDGWTVFQDHVLEEAADVIVTVQNLCMSHGITLYELESAMVKVAQKNDMKTSETHQWVNGKITRR